MCRVKGFVQSRELVFGVARDSWMIQDALIGCHGWIIATSEVAADADLFTQFHAGLEKVGVEPQELIDLAE